MLGILLAFGAGSALAADAAEQKVRDAIKTLVPDARIDSVRPSELTGFYEVVMGGQPLYVSADGRFLMSGALWDIGAKRNLTEARLASVRKDAIDAVGAEQRIIYAANPQKHMVTVFTDIDCGYCRRLHQQMAEYNKAGISIEYLFFPRAGIGSESYDKAVSVWCASDRNVALTMAKNGDAVENKTCSNPIASQFDLGQKVGISGTPAVIAEDGSQIGGYLTPEQMIARLDQIKAGAKAN
jgi:thiol:disulfide interchange protein DsbC